MALVIPDGYYEAAWHHTQANTTRTAVCTMGAIYVGEDFDVDAPLFGGAWGSILGEICNVITWSRFTLRNADGIVVDLSVNVPGGNTDACASYQNAYLVKKVTAVTGRAGQGRMYLPGVSEIDVDPAGVISTASYNSLQTALGAMLDEMATRNFLPAILHQERPVPADTPSPSTIVSLNLDHRIATQRHRLRG